MARAPPQVGGAAPTPLAPSELGPAPAALPAAAVPERRLRHVLGAIVAVTVLLTVGMGLWRMSPGNSAVQPASDTQPIAASKRIPTRNLAAYDHYLCAEAKRRAAVGNDQLRAVLATYRSAFSLDPDFAEAHAGYALAAISLWQRSIDSPLPSIGACAEAYNAAGRAL